MRERARISGIFRRGDLDGFFGLFVDNLLQILLIAVLGPRLCGFSPELIADRILPGVAASVVFGNLFYAWQARQLSARTGRDDVTALPYGINTVSLMAFIFLVMAPVYRETGDGELAWRVGLFACFLNAVMELLGAFVADWLRRNTPRAALLSALAGIALTFISMGFVFQIFASPGVALLPMLLLIIVYAGRIRLPLGLPGGLMAVLLGIALGLIARWNDGTAPVQPGWVADYGWHGPRAALEAMLDLADSPLGWQYLAVILPMGMLNIIGSLQNLESAEAAGDRYETRPSLLANGIGSLVAAAFGSAFPTTIYIGLPAWKRMGAGHGYSVLNALVIALLCFTGLHAAVVHWVPIEATLGILVWIGHHHGSGVSGNPHPPRPGGEHRPAALVGGLGVAAGGGGPAGGRHRAVRGGGALRRRPAYPRSDRPEPGFRLQRQPLGRHPGACHRPPFRQRRRLVPGRGGTCLFRRDPCLPAHRNRGAESFRSKRRPSLCRCLCHRGGFAVVIPFAPGS